MGAVLIVTATINRLVRTLEQRGDFLPDLCKVQSVFTLILVGELIALALVVASHGLRPFNWEALGIISFLVQWVVLASAACLCPLRGFFAKRSLLLASCSCFGLVMVVTATVSLASQWLFLGGAIDFWLVTSNMLVAAIFSGIAFRYFYIQQQLLVQEESELKARIQALQSRIRPHFLFNCMNSIVSLIGSDPEKAERVVEDLSDLFRASLAEPGLVPIRHELSLCRQYISIEQLRLGSRLKLEWQVEDLSDDIKIPSLLMQPIVENAIYHGVQPRADGGLVEISVSKSDNLIKVRVRNPLPQRFEQTAKPGNRVAIDNIKHRLAAYYGDDASFEAGEFDDCYVTEISYDYAARKA